MLSHVITIEGRFSYENSISPFCLCLNTSDLTVEKMEKYQSVAARRTDDLAVGGAARPLQRRNEIAEICDLFRYAL